MKQLKEYMKNLKHPAFKTVMAIGLSTMCAFSTNATEHQLVGKVYILSTTDKDIDLNNQGSSTLRLNNTTLSAGKCFRGSSGYLVMPVRNNPMGERMYTMLLAAQLSDIRVRVTINDDFRDSGSQCYVQRVRIEPS